MGAMQYFVVIGQKGAQIEEVMEEVVPHHFNQAGFNSRSEAEHCVKAVEVNLQPSLPNTNNGSDRYPNSSTHWEESDEIILPIPSPSLTPDLPTGPTAMIESAPLNVNQTAQVGVIKLSKEQKQVLETVKAGGNVFFTGPAGTGKSVLLREIIKVLRSRKLEVAVTASTGIAGINIKGSTVHSWAGIGLGKEKAAILASRIANSTHARISWTETDVLIIDEISMIDGRLFDKLEYIGRIVRNNSRPFGGIQLVISGDFFQLPPVPDKSYQHKMPSVFAFDAESWPLCIKKIVLLTHVFRQRDQAFVDILAEMRVGKLSDDHIKALHALRRPVVHPDGVEPSHLFATKLEVQDCNQRKLDALRSPSVTYHSMDYRGIDVQKNLIDKKEAARLLSEQVALEEVTLKIGAQVMLITNVIQGSLVNGSLGKVIGFMTTHQALQEHIRVVEMRQVGGPRATAKNQVPTKRPRIESNDPELEFEPLNTAEFTKDEKWPLVEFTSGLLLLCSPENFTIEGFLGNVEAKRIQVPLILAWALSIHKSQGQTLERVKVDLGRVFENGQAYVALSRATSLEGLEIVNFNPAKIQAHSRVLAWQKQWMPQSLIKTLNKTQISEVSKRPSTPTRAVTLPSPRSLVRSAKQRQPDPDRTLYDDAEMDCDEAISRYHDHLPISPSR